ncbi:MAG: cytosine deaminase [Alphaproteobacteria bacterium]
MPDGPALKEVAAGGHFWLRNGRIPGCLLAGDLPARADGLVDADVLIEAGRIKAICPPGSQANDAPPGFDMRCGQVWPCFIDVHTHLDKGHTAPRAPNTDGGFASALVASRHDGVRHWTVEDVRARMEFSLKSAYVHGTAAIRTHLSSDPETVETSWPALVAARTDWAGRIDLQAVAILDIAHFGTEFGGKVAALAARHGAVLGAYVYQFDGLEAALRGLFAAAETHQLDLDLHVDETLDAAAGALARVAQMSVETGYSGTLVAGHCCSLTTQDAPTIARTLDAVARAGIAIVSLPMCNLYLQDRSPSQTPRRRGGTLLHEMREHGIEIAVASDNTRDAFYAYGDLDGLEVFREAVRILHLDHPMGDWPALVTKWPAVMMGLADRGEIALGAIADLVLFDGRDYSELLSRPEAARQVLRAGQPIDRALPDYRALDNFMGAD